jgi:NAD-dependent dihydropyrimidine dehydrogenase PreA subunit
LVSDNKPGTFTAAQVFPYHHMNSAPVILCDCVHTQLLPPDATAQLAGALQAAGVPFARVPDLCRLAATRDTRLAEWSRQPDLKIIACFPRAVRWLFHWAGHPLADDIAVLNLRRQLAADVAGQLGLPAAVPIPAASANGDWVPWFPVLDYDKCTNCDICRNFCAFGVYDQSDTGLVAVAHPQNCKNNCPACARMCPQGAIIFPKCADAAIAGGERLPGEAAAALPDPLSILSRDEINRLLAKRRERAAAFRAAQAGH